MTFSVVGRCPIRNQFGIAISTSSIAVGSRCPWVRAGIGAVVTQNVTDPRLGNEILDLLADGFSPKAAIQRKTDGRAHSEHRQLTAIDSQGRTAHFTGAKTLGTNAVAEGKNCIAAGNLLSDSGVVRAMVAGFEVSGESFFADRLLAALRAGLEAGGEEGPVHSASLLVAGEQSWPLVDLRVDWHDADPIGQLTRLWKDYEPQMDDYVIRALDPDSAPSYGVPGDL